MTIVGMSSPSLNEGPFEEMARRVANEFRMWEVICEAGHHASMIRDTLSDLIATTGIRFQFHAPFSDLNPASINPKAFDLALQQTEEVVAMATSLDQGPITVHPGHLAPYTSQHHGKAIAVAASAMERFDKLQTEYSARIGIENMPRAGMMWKLFYSNEEMARLLDGTGLGFTFDIGHAHTACPISDFEPLRDRIINVHVHDNDGTGDQHLVLGSGGLDLDEIVRFAKGRDWPWVIESRDFGEAVEAKPVLEGLLKRME